MKNLITTWQENKDEAAKENARFVQQLKQYNKTSVDAVVHKMHTKVFKQIDCVTCANCCKILQPYFTQSDIERIAAHMQLSPSTFAEKYLEINNYKEFRMASKPCVFLNANNTCSIYSIRPENCQTYPHTNRVNFNKRGAYISEHTQVCPAVYHILEAMKQEFDKND